MDSCELCVASDLANLAQIAEFVVGCASRAGMDEDQAFAIQVAVDEACTNSIEHAYEGRTDGVVRVCCYTDEDSFVVEISDTGRPFDPASVPLPDVCCPLDQRQIGGLGLYLMHQLMDEVTFRFDEQHGNQVVMRKRRKAST